MFARLHALQPRAEEASPTYIILSFTNLFIGWPSVKLQVLGLELKMQSPPSMYLLRGNRITWLRIQEGRGKLEHPRAGALKRLRGLIPRSGHRPR